MKRRDKNVEALHHRGGKGIHRNKQKDIRLLRKKIRSELNAKGN